MGSIGIRSVLKRAVALALFALPILYVSGILSTAVHEVLGHGLWAVLLGGEFSGFVLKWDAMGWAYSDLPASATLWHHILYLGSGIIAGIVCGGVLLGFAFVISKKPHVQLAMLILSYTCLIDSISYVLWNAYWPVPPGDIGRIIWLWGGPRPPDDSIIRWVLLIAGAMLSAGTVFCFSTSIFVRVETLVLGDGQFKGRSRLLALFLSLALPGSIGWFLFDWNQLAPGVGLLPCVTGALSDVAAAVLLFWYRPKAKYESGVHPITRRHLAVSWMSPHCDDTCSGIVVQRRHTLGIARREWPCEDNRPPGRQRFRQVPVLRGEGR